MGKVVSIKKFLNYDDMVKMENDLEKKNKRSRLLEIISFRVNC